MSTWVKVGGENAAGIADNTASILAVDGATAATPLAAMHQGQMPEVGLLSTFMGKVGGCIGETSVVLLLIGFAYLLWRKVITPRIPLAYIGTVAVLTFLFPMGQPRVLWMAYQLCSGGLMLGAIFMATDYVTSPVTAKGQIVYGIGCGALTVLIRYFGGYNEGVSYAILVMNICVVLLDRIGRPNKYGAPKKRKEGAK
jgi:electron transport complex protein RnfD